MQERICWWLHCETGIGENTVLLYFADDLRKNPEYILGHFIWESIHNCCFTFLNHVFLVIMRWRVSTVYYILFRPKEHSERITTRCRFNYPERFTFFFSPIIITRDTFFFWNKVWVCLDHSQIIIIWIMCRIIIIIVIMDYNNPSVCLPSLLWMDDYAWLKWKKSWFGISWDNWLRTSCTFSTYIIPLNHVSSEL